MKKEVIIRKFLLVVIIMVLSTLVKAQVDIPEPPTDSGGDPWDVQDVYVPFDGGVSLLVAAGIGYGVKKAREKRKADKM